MLCATCEPRTCFTGQGEMPAGCPEQNMKTKTSEPVDGFLEYASRTREKEIDRIGELIEYAHFRDYKKIGVAACIGLHDELRIVADRLKKSGLKVSSVMCKTGSLKKKELSVPARYRMTTQTGYGIGVIACNPAAQALIFNQEETDLNCILGLCVGHDSVFMKHSQAPVVTLIAKDRTNTHNPASILYGFYGDNFFTRRPSPEGSAKFNSKHITPFDIFRMIRKKMRS